jgi:hypothetical protein
MKGIGMQFLTDQMAIRAIGGIAFLAMMGFLGSMSDKVRARGNR